MRETLSLYDVHGLDVSLSSGRRTATADTRLTTAASQAPPMILVSAWNVSRRTSLILCFDIRKQACRGHS